MWFFLFQDQNVTQQHSVAAHGVVLSLSGSDRYTAAQQHSVETRNVVAVQPHLEHCFSSRFPRLFTLSFEIKAPRRSTL